MTTLKTTHGRGANVHGAKTADLEGTVAQRTPGAPSIQINVPAIYHNALPPNITPSSSLGTPSTSTLYDCRQSNNFPFFAQQMGRSHAPCPCRPHHGHPPQNQRIPFLCMTDHSNGHTEEWESLTPTRGATPKPGKTLPGSLLDSNLAFYVRNIGWFNSISEFWD